jgi:hypothetical protein
MIVEERTYVLHTEVRLSEFLRTYESEGLPVQLEILDGFMGYFVTEFGTLNQVVHMWAYKDLEDRRQRRIRLHENAQWLSCLEKIRPMIKSMENRIMYPTAFSPLPANMFPALASRGQAGERRGW